jgi:hypothetical protein
MPVHTRQSRYWTPLLVPLNIKILEYTKLTNIYWQCCDIKIWKLCDNETLQVQARSRVYFVWSRYTNICLGASRPYGAVSGRDFTSLCFYASCQITPLNLRSFIFGLTPFGWLHSFTLTPYFWWECHFWFTYILFTPTVCMHATRA